MIEFMIETMTLPVLIIGIISAIFFWCCCRVGSRKPPPLITEGQAVRMCAFNRDMGRGAQPAFSGNESVYCTYHNDYPVIEGKYDGNNP